jgi:hypothetical protein
MDHELLSAVILARMAVTIAEEEEEGGVEHVNVYVYTIH